MASKEDETGEEWLRNVPGESIWDKAYHLLLAERDAALKLTTIKAMHSVAKTMIAEERKVNRFLAARARYQEQFGFGMSTPKNGH
jgi:hypothetical protein